jgi:hypothetical protein
MIKCSKTQATIMLTPRGRSAELAMITRSAGDVINQEKTPVYSKGNKATEASESASWQSIKVILTKL